MLSYEIQRSVGFLVVLVNSPPSLSRSFYAITRQKRKTSICLSFIYGNTFILLMLVAILLAKIEMAWEACRQMEKGKSKARVRKSVAIEHFTNVHAYIFVCVFMCMLSDYSKIIHIKLNWMWNCKRDFAHIHCDSIELMQSNQHFHYAFYAIVYFVAWLAKLNDKD